MSAPDSTPTCCAFQDCGDPACPVCSVPRRFPPVNKRASDLHPNAPALVGTKPRASRDPRFIKRRRKPL